MNKILVLYEKHVTRYIGGDMDKAALMIVKERYEQGLYDEMVGDYPVKEVLDTSNAKWARGILHMRSSYEYEEVEFETLEVATYLKPCPDITQRARELKEYKKCIEFDIRPIIIQDYIADGEEPPNEKDLCYMTYEYVNYYDYADLDHTLTDHYLQEWFGDVKIYHNSNTREIEISR